MNARGPPLDELGKGLTRSQGWSGFVRNRHQGPSLQNRMKGGFVSAKRVEGEGIHEKDRRGERNERDGASETE